MKLNFSWKALLLLSASFLFSINAFAQGKPVKVPGIPVPMTCENSPVSYAVNGNTLTIEAGAKTDMFRDPNVTYNTDNAPKLVFTADPNFILTAGIEPPFTSKCDGGG